MGALCDWRRGTVRVGVAVLACAVSGKTAVQAGGAGIDQGVAGVSTDFEGKARPQGSAADIGAYEFVP